MHRTIISYCKSVIKDTRCEDRQTKMNNVTTLLQIFYYSILLQLNSPNFEYCALTKLPWIYRGKKKECPMWLCCLYKLYIYWAKWSSKKWKPRKADLMAGNKDKFVASCMCNHICFSNLSSLFTLCIDLINSSRKTPAGFWTSNSEMENENTKFNSNTVRYNSSISAITCTSKWSIRNYLSSLIAERDPEV